MTAPTVSETLTTPARVLPGKWIVAVDLGQAVDPTAIAVLDVTTRAEAVARYYAYSDDTRPAGVLVPQREWYHATGDGGLKDANALARVDVRHLERLPLRMSYVDQVAYIASVLRRPPLHWPRAALVVDQTGVGRPVVDVFRRAGLRPVGVTITAGDGVTRTDEGDYRVSKLHLVSGLQADLHSGVLRWSKKLREAQALAIELQDFRANISETGFARFGAREGAHDDLVLAVAIGRWYASYAVHRVAHVFPFSI